MGNLIEIVEYRSNARDEKYEPKHISYPTIEDIMEVAFKYVTTGDMRYLGYINIPTYRTAKRPKIIDMCVRTYCLSMREGIPVSYLHKLVDPVLKHMCLSTTNYTTKGAWDYE